VDIGWLTAFIDLPHTAEVAAAQTTLDPIP
jgi:hypothetical protein